jgi:hypothetical protein
MLLKYGAFLLYLETVESEDGYVNGYIHAEGEELEGEPEDSWEQVGPKKKSVLTRRVCVFKIWPAFVNAF